VLGPLESNPRTVAWILYAAGIAAGRAPASLTDISTAADAINHAVPTHRELAGSLSWLASHGLVESAGRFHALSPAGRVLLEQAQSSSPTVSGVWAHLAEGVRRISAGA
jgi:hypothetical protein